MHALRIYLWSDLVEVSPSGWGLPTRWSSVPAWAEGAVDFSIPGVVASADLNDSLISILPAFLEADLLVWPMA
jgi:hypothetical protein